MVLASQQKVVNFTGKYLCTFYYCACILRIFKRKEGVGRFRNTEIALVPFRDMRFKRGKVRGLV